MPGALEDMRDFLNRMPGPPLTITDVIQHLKVFDEEKHSRYPNEQLQPGCSALHEREKADGTELSAIVGLLRDFIEQENKPTPTSFGCLPTPHGLRHPGHDLPQDWRGCREVQAGETSILGAERFPEIQSDFGMVQDELPGGTR